MFEANVGVDQIRNILVDTQLTDQQIESSIASAMIVVNNESVLANNVSNAIVDITMYLAAHFASLRDPTTRIKNEKIGDAEVEYDINKPPANFMDLSSTRWGATAIVLDQSGILQQLGKKKPRLFHLGESS